MLCIMSYRVPFSETDAMGIVHHSNHVRYLERGRVEFLRLIELSYADLVRKDIHFPVLEVNCQYKKPIYFDDLILVESKVSATTKTRVNFSYRILRSREKYSEASLIEKPVDGELLAIGESKHCCINTENKPAAMPQNVYDRLNTMVEK